MAQVVHIGGYPFSCLPLGQAKFTDVAAIYAVLDVAPGGQWTVLDIGQSGQVGTRLDSHDRRDCWLRQARYKNNIWVGVFRTPTSNISELRRLQIESQLRTQFCPKCGCR